MIIKWCRWFLLTDFKLMFLSFCQGLVQCLCMLKYFQVFKIIAIFQIWIFKMFLFLWCFIFTYKALKQFSLSWTKVAYHWSNACAVDQCLKYYTIFIILVNTYYIIYDLYSFTYSLQFEIIYLKNLFACQIAAYENMSPRICSLYLHVTYVSFRSLLKFGPFRSAHDEAFILHTNNTTKAFSHNTFTF